MTAPVSGNSTEQTKNQPDTDASQPADGASEPNPVLEEADGGREDELPEWARKRLTKANMEAANYRTRLREAEAKLAAAKTPDELDAAVKDFKAKNEQLERELAVSTLARRYGLPDDLAACLKGDTPGALEAHAKALTKYATPAEPVALSGGLDPTDDGDGFDPVAEARKARAGRR